MDSWGLLIFSRARQYRSNICPLMMTRALFDRYSSDSAVNEPVVAQPAIPEGLID
ncbi:Wadjet anti-phage system protein JetD domain-containing protein [Methylovulum miyakonense]|uniref:Wadjet anti-phage system protein JetD domain-containing protein n=1 Tax=Methylovulum miyakonense TaxID=645578 RepID=UPI003BB5CE35